MSAVFQWTTDGLERNLELCVGEWSGYHVHLFVNNHTPVPGDNTWPGSFVECSDSYYTSQTLGSLSSPALTGNIAYTDSATLNFGTPSSGTPAAIYGYAVTNNADSSVRFAELLDSPITPTLGFPVLLQIRLRDRNP